MQKIFGLLLLGFVSTLLFPLFPPPLKADVLNPDLVISEIQTGGCTAYDELNQCIGEDTDMEFVELYNPLSIELHAHNWEVQYISASGETITTLVTLDGTMLPRSYVLLGHEGYLTNQADLFFNKSLAKSGGHVRIIDDSSQVIDLVGWGTASATGSWPKVSEITAGFSIKRVFPDDPLAGIGIIFTPSTLPLTPESGGYVVNLPSDEDSGDTGDGGMGGSDPINNCEGVIISELLPNPAGSDTDQEFIELYNPTGSAISLEGCQLSTTANSKLFTFGETELSAGQYMAFYSDVTGLTLANSAGGSAFLVDADDTEISQVDYPADLEDDVAWALVEGGWVATYAPTPNTANSLLADKPCPAGEIRNTDTNRCVSVLSEALGLVACKPGQERNPETNRCRNIASLSAALKACEPGQVRNPATNRCRKASSSSLTPCKPGQERNPQTNRCRNASGSSSDKVANVKDVLAATSADKGSWALAGATMFGAVGYGVWEWRNELGRRLLWLKSKFPFKLIP